MHHVQRLALARRLARARPAVVPVGNVPPPQELSAPAVELPTTGLVALYDAALGATVSSWADQQGGDPVIQASAGNQPTIAATVAAINDQPAVVFDGVDDIMSRATISV